MGDLRRVDHVKAWIAPGWLMYWSSTRMKLSLPTPSTGWALITRKATVHRLDRPEVSVIVTRWSEVAGAITA